MPPRSRGSSDGRDADRATVALLEERPVARVGERAAVDVRQDDDALHAQLAKCAVELAERAVRIIHGDRGEPLEALRMLRGEIGVRVVRESRDFGLPLR